MTFLADVAAAPVPADAVHTYRMPTMPQLVEPAPAQDPALTTRMTAGAFGELWIDDRTPVCPWCFEDLGSEWCCCGSATQTTHRSVA